jgi:hypothetical protein
MIHWHIHKYIQHTLRYNEVLVDSRPFLYHSLSAGEIMGIWQFIVRSD